MEPSLLIEDSFFSGHGLLFDYLVSHVPWNSSMQARKTASFGRPYNYSQMRYPDTAIPDPLLVVRDLLASRLKILFNNCLLNYYETGKNSIGFHADDTNGLLPNTGVAIVSLGAARDITYRRKDDASILVNYALQPGSMLYMDDAVQQDWLHGVRAQKGVGPRISLTWRAIA